MNTLQYSAKEDADWRAFRYVAGELTAAEQTAFEADLADELAAGNLGLSEAVARALEVGQTVQAAETQIATTVAVRSRSAWRTKLGWLAAGGWGGAAARAGTAHPPQ